MNLSKPELPLEGRRSQSLLRLSIIHSAYGTELSVEVGCQVLEDLLAGHTNENLTSWVCPNKPGWATRSESPRALSGR